MLAYYRLMAAWMLRMASPAAAAGGQPQLPLPTPAPEHFRMLPVLLYFLKSMPKHECTRPDRHEHAASIPCRALSFVA